MTERTPPPEGAAPRSATAATRIRPASEGDLDALVEVFWTVAAEGRWLGSEVPFDRGARRERFAATIDSADSTFLLAVTRPAQTQREELVVVGFVSVHVAPYGVADIGMAILEAWRGQGIGRALLDEAITWATAAGAHKMSLEVWPDNSRAEALYRSAGFAVEGRKVAHYRRRNGELWDSVLMGRPLP